MDSQFILGDGDHLDALAPDADMIVMSASRASVEASRTGDFVDRLLSLSDSRDHTLRFAGAVALYVEGYDHDPRELTAIPEVVAFFRAVADAWPFAFHFFATDTDSLQLYLHFLIHLEPVPSTSTDRVVHRISPAELAALAKRHFHAMNLLHEQHDVPADKRAEISGRIAAVLQSHLSGEG